jgi:predicted lipase
MSSLGISDVSGYIAVDDINKRIILAYQGSADWRDWLDDLTYGRVSTDICGTHSIFDLPFVDDCEVHSGFLQNWVDSSEFVIDTPAKAKAANPSYRVVSTGHSKGGAVAAVAAAVLRNKGYAVDLVSLALVYTTI